MQIKTLSTPVWAGSAAPSHHTDNHLLGLARLSFTCLREVRRREEKKNLSEEGFLQSKALTEEIFSLQYSTDGGQAGSPTRGTALPPPAFSL